MPFSSPPHLYQRTLKETLSFQGIGLHSGKDITLTLKPASAYRGLIFCRSDISKEKTFPLKAEYVSQTILNTTISHPDDPRLSISTIEHLLSALHALSIDNLYIEINGPELPALDGSAKEFLRMLKETGTQDLTEPKKFIKILRPLSIHHKDGGWVRLSPTKEAQFSLHISIDFPSPLIGQQEHFYKIAYHCPKERQKSYEDYMNNIAPARTFIDYASIQKLQSQGLALGGSLSNALVIDHDHLLNPQGLYFSNEFARHKLLDAFGDIYCASHPLIGHFEGFKCGHTLNNSLLRTLLSKTENWCFI